MMENLKLPPHDIESEIAVLGGILVNNKVFPEVNAILNAEDFYREAHGNIYKAMWVLFETDSPVDIITIKDKLLELNLLEKSGGLDYIVSIADSISTSGQVGYYSKIIKSLSQKRQLITLCQSIAGESFQDFSQVDSILENIKDGITSIEKSKTLKIKDNLQLYTEVYKSFDQCKDPGLETGIPGLEKRFFLEPGYIHCIAAESGIGKSAILLQIGDHISSVYDSHVLFYTMESTSQKLATRNVARHAKVALTRLTKSNIQDPHHAERVYQATSYLSNSKLHLLDDPYFMEIENIISHSESFTLKNDMKMICIDFLQAMETKKQFRSEREKINYFISRLKAHAKRLNVPILFACQLRKDVNGRPKLDDLIESNYIRTHTDNIMFLWAPDSDPAQYPVEMFLAKGKDQERFSIGLQFDGNYQDFKEGPKPVEKKKKQSSWIDE